MLEDHRLLLSDEPRLRALARAVDAVVAPGDVVLDVASGTGILGLMACRAGAARVYAIEDTSIAELARAIVRANGVCDRMRVVLAHSSWAEIDEPADVLVCDQIGQFGFDAGLLECVRDARRLLKPGARVIPASVDLQVALVEHDEARERVDFWGHRPGGFEFSPAGETAANSGHSVRLERRDLLSDPVLACSLDPARAGAEPIAFSLQLTATRDGRLDGIGGWFSATLAPGVTMSNAPGAPDRVARRNRVFPIDPPIALRAGDLVAVTMRIRSADHLVRWTVDVRSGDVRVDRSTFRGMFVPREMLARTRSSFAPRLTARGRARLTVLELCDGRPLADIEREVFTSHGDLFETPAAAELFVAEVVTRYCE